MTEVRVTKCLTVGGLKPSDLKKYGLSEDDPHLRNKLVALRDELRRSAWTRVVSAEREAKVVDAMKYNADGTVKKSYSDNTARAFTSLFVHALDDQGNDVGLASRIKAIKGSLHRLIAKDMERLRAKRAGLAVDKEGRRNVIHELAGKKTGDAEAAGTARSVRHALDTARDWFNTAGGRTAYIKNWLPQSHNASAIRRMGSEAWKDLAREVFDKSQTERVLQQSLSEKQWGKLLNEVFENLASDGTRKLTGDGLSPFARRALGETHAQMRVLHFKDSDGWLKYDGLAGRDDPWGAVTDYLDMMARDIGAIEMFGPNADATVRNIAAMVTRDYAKKGSSPRNAPAFGMNIWEDLQGRTHAQGTRVTDAFKTARAVMVTTKLGAAIVSAITDPMFIAVTQTINGMPVFRTLAGLIRGLNPLNTGDRQFAASLGLGLDYAMDRAGAALRHADALGYGRAERAADLTLRVSGLNIWTHAAKETFGLEFIRFTTQLVHTRTLAQLATSNRKTFRMLQRYGFTEAEWSRLRNVPLEEYRGAKYMDVNALGTAPEDRELANKFIGMILEEREYAVPETTERTRALLAMGTKSNTLIGEGIRSGMQFKSFPTTVMTTHLSRMFALGKAGEKGDLVSYASTLLVGGTALGALSIQAKAVIRGEDTIEMFHADGTPNADLWVPAFMQVSLGGPIGDILVDALGGRRGAIGDAIAGPLGGDVGHLLSTLGRTSSQAFQGKGRKALGTLVEGTTKFTPSLFYVRTPLRRGIQNLVTEIDPSAKVRYNAKRTRIRSQGRKQWWKEGDLAPYRSPKGE